MIETIKTTKISSKRQITIPVEFSEFKPGNKALFIKRNNEIVIKPISKKIPEALILSELSLQEGWNSKEDEEAFSYLQDE